MSNNILLQIDTDLPSEKIGAKANGLRWLHNNNFPIPRTYFTEALPLENYTETYYKNLFDEVCNLFSDGDKIALRSSGINEDGLKESKAGNYKTALNINPKDMDKLHENHKKIIADAAEKNDRAGVIVQQMIQDKISGVMFTSNPNNFSKQEMIISYCDGLGENLVSGLNNKTHDLQIDKKKPVESLKDKTLDEKIKAAFKDLIQIGIEIENKFNRPMDIEWVIEKDTFKIYLLQCRPITTILLEKSECKKITIKSIGDDERLKSLSKVKIRLESEANDIMISDAYIINCNCTDKDFPFAEPIQLKKSQFCKGYNIVVITPELIDGKVLRHFIGKKSDAISCITCNRYNFRAFPKYENIDSALRCIYNEIKDSTWICTMIIQEIFDPKFTGIIKQNKDTTFIEVARGHFVAKGVVPMSIYSINNGKVISKKEEKQNKYYRILEGHQIEQEIDLQLTHIDDDLLLDIQRQFAPILEQENSNIEFGILDDDGDNYPYLIDYTIDKSEESLDSNDIEQGIISRGSITGKLVELYSQDIEHSLNAHCKNEISMSNETCEPVIYMSDLPRIDLMEKLEQKNIGFIFKGGSMLCHLAILLRERGIPAIIKQNTDDLTVGEIYSLNTYKSDKIQRNSNR